MIFDQKIILPIVHAEVNFISPILLGDELSLTYQIEFKNTSFKILVSFFCDNKKKGEVEITHVCIDSGLNKKISSRELFHDLLEF